MCRTNHIRYKNIHIIWIIYYSKIIIKDNKSSGPGWRRSDSAGLWASLLNQVLLSSGFREQRAGSRWKSTHGKKVEIFQRVMEELLRWSVPLAFSQFHFPLSRIWRIWPALWASIYSVEQFGWAVPEWRLVLAVSHEVCLFSNPQMSEANQSKESCLAQAWMKASFFYAFVQKFWPLTIPMSLTALTLQHSYKSFHYSYKKTVDRYFLFPEH